MSQDTEALTAGAPSRMAQTNSRSAQNLMGAAGSGVEILGVVAAVTQAVPYLGIISGGLTEILKIYNEVDKFKSEWRSVLDDVSRLKTIVDTVRDELDRSRDEDKRLPPGLTGPLKELENCIFDTRRTMYNCKPDVGEDLQGKHLGRLKARGLRAARIVLNRKDLLDSVNRCRANMSTMLHVFNARLNVSHAFALDHQTQRFNKVLVASGEENPSLPARDVELYVSEQLIDSRHRILHRTSLAKKVDPTGSLGAILSDQARGSPDTTFRLQVSLTVPANVRVNWPIALNQIRHVISRFAPGDQDIIWRGLAVLVLGVIEATPGGHGQAVAVPAAHGSICVFTEVLETTVVPMVCAFLLLFMIYKLHSVTRPLGWSNGSVIVVDFLGRAFELHSDTFATWENTHEFLVEAFQGQPGASYVTNRTYGLENSEHILIIPKIWSEVVRPGAKLQMSAVVREESYRCPYCQTAFDPQSPLMSATDKDRMICTNALCGRSYGVLHNEIVLGKEPENAPLSEQFTISLADLPRSAHDHPHNRPPQHGKARFISAEPSLNSLGLIKNLLVLFRETTADGDAARTILKTIVSGQTGETSKFKAKGKAVWPPYLVTALVVALDKYRPNSSQTTPSLSRYPGRNRFISDFIYQLTGKRRTTKQVASQLQVLRYTYGGKQFLEILRDHSDDEGISPNVNMPTTQNETHSGSVSSETSPSLTPTFSQT